MTSNGRTTFRWMVWCVAGVALAALSGPAALAVSGSAEFGAAESGPTDANVPAATNSPAKSAVDPVTQPTLLVREVVYNELHDHEGHGWWRYWIERHSGKENKVIEQVETADGPMTRLTRQDGHTPTREQMSQEDERIRHLLNSPGEQAKHRQDYLEDERRIGRILALLPDAFQYEYVGVENGCYHYRFQPNPNYPPHSIEARIFHAMAGDIWINARYKRLAQLNGKLKENVDFGYGILGRLYQGGWFELRRAQVSQTDWKTDRLEVHMEGRAMLFKSLAKETSETRGGFTPVPASLTLTQASLLLQQAPMAASVQTAAYLPSKP